VPDRLTGCSSAGMSARIEQAKWAVILLMRENPPGRLRLDDERRMDLDRLDQDLALGGFLRAVSRGDVDEGHGC
jgi:hypothetical protein